MELKASQSPLKAFFFHEPFSQNFWPDILDEVYKKNVYQRFVNSKKDLIIVDCGANLGLTAYYFKDYAKQVYAVEPSQQHFESLSKMVEFNKIKNITPIKLAISNKNGKEKFYHNLNQTMFSLEATVNDANDFEEVDTMTMDKFMETYKLDHIDILKLDPEGMEAKILQSEGFKKVAPKVKTILGEWHNWCGVSQENFQHGVEELGYQFKWRRDTVASVYEAERV